MEQDSFLQSIFFVKLTRQNVPLNFSIFIFKLDKDEQGQFWYMKFASYELASLSIVSLILILFLNKYKIFSALLFRRLLLDGSVAGFIRSLS